MEDATIILPPGAAVGDDAGLRHVFELFAATTGARWAELVIRSTRSNQEQVVRIGEPEDRHVTAELDLDRETRMLLRLGSDTTPTRRALDLLADGLRREFERLRLLAESALLRGALDATTAAILLFGPSGGILYANRRADELISKQTEDELMVNGDGQRPQPLFRLLCAKVGDLLDNASRQPWRGRLEVSDGSDLSGELFVLDRTSDSLGPVVLAVLREVAGPPDRRVDDFAAAHHLSPREREVLRLLVQGLDTTGLADRLGISPHTVRDHLKNVFRKTSRGSRSELLSALTGAANHQAK
jgi:DNA-binding CsgD family transcriptional regulator